MNIGILIRKEMLVMSCEVVKVLFYFVKSLRTYVNYTRIEWAYYLCNNLKNILISFIKTNTSTKCDITTFTRTVRVAVAWNGRRKSEAETYTYTRAVGRKRTRLKFFCCGVITANRVSRGERKRKKYRKVTKLRRCPTMVYILNV